MNDNIKGVTEVGKAIYPHLNKPDTRFQKEGVYKVTLELSPVNAKNLLKHIDDGIKLATKDSKSNKTAQLPYKTDENGNMQFNFKCKASGVSKTGQNWEQKPKVFDSKGTPISKDILVWGGTTMKVAYEIIPYSNNMLGSGVSLRLKAVQVHELVSGGGASADSYGFKEEANGYVAETVDSFPEAEVNGQEDF
tara:strand:- start:440 stop:1018 length:579 start_codon:yes stop_codon:yes gene_type:complete